MEVKRKMSYEEILKVLRQAREDKIEVVESEDEN